MFLLDSDHLSFLWRGEGDEFKALLLRLADHSEKDVFISIVTIEEQLRGWLAYVKKSSRIDGVIKGYSKLHEVIQRFAESQIVDFDEAAGDVFSDLRSQGVRIGTMDLRVAAIAISKGMTLFSRNTIDFEKVVNLRFEDWTIFNER